MVDSPIDRYSGVSGRPSSLQNVAKCSKHQVLRSYSITAGAEVSRQDTTGTLSGMRKGRMTTSQLTCVPVQDSATTKTTNATPMLCYVSELSRRFIRGRPVAPLCCSEGQPAIHNASITHDCVATRSDFEHIATFIKLFIVIGGSC